jgi:hypothetical protein
MKPSSSSSSAGRHYEPFVVETAIPFDDDAHWQSSSLPLQPLPPPSSQTSSTATTFQLATISTMVGSVAALLGLASLDVHAINVQQPQHGCLFALTWSGLTALTAYLIFERLVPKSQAATGSSTSSSSSLLVEFGVASDRFDETATYRLLSDEPNDDDTAQCEHAPPPQARHADQQRDSRASTVFVWGTYVSFSVTCLVHDVVTHSSVYSLPHYWLYGAVTVVTIVGVTSAVVVSQCTANLYSNGGIGSSNNVDDDDHGSLFAPVTV